MRYVFSGISIILISVLVRGFYTVLNNPKSPEKGMVYLPKIICILGIVCSIVSIVPAVITLFSEYEFWVTLIFLVFTLLGVSLVVAYCNCRITYDENHFIYKNFFGVKKRFEYGEVTSIKENMHEKFLYIGKHKVMIDEYSIGGKEFVLYVKKKYRQLHNGMSIPKVYKTKHDIFNGNINDAGGFIFVYILMFAAFLVTLVVLVDYAFLSPLTPDDTIKQNLYFDLYSETNNEMVLKSTDNTIYKISFNAEEFDADVIKKICDGKTYVTVYSKMITPDDEEDYYSIKAVAYNNKYLLSFEQTNTWHTQDSWIIIVYVSVFLVIWCIYVVLSIIVGRNPQKYSRKVIKLFFQDGYVRY